MANEQEFSVKGPIFKLAVKHGQEAMRHVAGKKPKAMDMAAVEALVAKGVYLGARFSPQKWRHSEGDLDRWIVGAPDSADYVEFMAPPHAALSKMKDLAASPKGKGPTKALMKRMMNAIQARNLAEVKSLAPATAAGSLDGRSTLHQAARYLPEAVSALLPHCDPNALEESTGRTALMAVLDYSDFRRFDCLPQLLAVSDIDRRDSGGATALMIASRYNSSRFFDVLKLSDAKLKDGQGWTALMHAADGGFSDLVEKLLPGSDPAAKDEEGRDALALVLSRDESRARDRYYSPSACVSLLLPHCDLGWRDPEGNTVAMILAKRNHWNLIEELGDRCDFGARNNEGDTLLILATRTGHWGTVAFLLPKSDATGKGKDGDTALIVAARANDAGLVRLLRGASDVDAQNDWGRTALMEALLAKWEEHRGPTVVGAIRCALQLFPKSNAALRDSDGRTALMHCLRLSLLELFELMLPSFDANSQDAEGSTALMLCDQDGRIRGSLADFVELLIPATNLKLRDGKGRTALMRLEGITRHPALLAGSDVDAQDEDGRTALMHAVDASWADASFVEMLLQVADAGLADKKGKTAAEFAREAGNDELATTIAKRALEQLVKAPKETEAEAAARRRKTRERHP